MLDNDKEEYGLVEFRPLSNKERWETYAKLTTPQRAVIDDHRKYLVRSEFVKNTYLKASDWYFVDLKIDARYPEKYETKYMLYCECGRRLKYQYIIASKKTGQEIKLGSQHFKDHLNIPQHVANEISAKINNVDYALDELLWLKRKNQTFPSELIERVRKQLFNLNHNQKNQAFNLTLVQRIFAFAEVDMPIYTADYQAIQQFLNLDLEVNSVDIQSKSYQYFQENITDYLTSQILYQKTALWVKQIQERMSQTKEQPKMPKRYFEAFHYLLTKIEMQTIEKIKAEIDLFSLRGLGKWIQPEVYTQISQALYQLGYTEDFLNVIHPFIREGLLEFFYVNQKNDIVNEESERDETPILNEMVTLLAPLSKKEQATLLKELLLKLKQRD